MGAFSLLLSLVLLTGVCGVATAADKTTRVEIRHKSRDLEKVNAELKKKRQEKKKLDSEAQKITENVKKNEAKMQDVEKSLLFAISRNREIQQDLAQEKLSHDRVINQVRARESDLSKSAEMVFVSARLLTPQSTLPVYSRQLFRNQLGHVKNLKQKKRESRDQLNNLTNTHHIFQKEIETQRSEFTGLQSGVKTAEKKLRKNQTRQQVVESELNELQQTAQELASLIDILRSQARQEKEGEKRARLEKQASGHSPILPRSLHWPIAGEIVRNFGRQKHPQLGTPYISNGLLIGPRNAGPLRVVADGTVLYAGEFMSYGLMAVVEHPGDWYTVYGNMGRWAVEKGQEIKKGDVVGWSGVSADGDHEAYFELRFYGKATDPRPWLTTSQTVVPGP